MKMKTIVYKVHPMGVMGVLMGVLRRFSVDFRCKAPVGLKVRIGAS